VVAGWSYTGGPPTPGGSGPVTLVQGRTFCVSDPTGDLGSAPTHGLFVADTRFVHRFVLRVDGDHLEPLGVQPVGPHATTFVTRRRPRSGLADSTLLVLRSRYVGNGLVEEVTLENLSRLSAEHAMSLAVEADFANIFAVKEGRAIPAGGRSTTSADGVITHACHGADPRSVDIRATGSPVAGGSVLHWRLVLPPRGRTTVTVRVEPAVAGSTLETAYPLGDPLVGGPSARRQAQWRDKSPSVHSSLTAFDELVATSTADLAGLRITDPGQPEREVIAAGAPWFMTFFGRDSLLTSWMLLPLDARIGLATLQVLAERQGEVVDTLTEEEPGRILHEIRSGLSATSVAGQEGVYYGSVDATPLFVMLAGELLRWGVPLHELEPLLPHVDRALEWVGTFGDRDGDGFVEYERATELGLANQGWKDSFDGITFPSGAFPRPPLALAEVQGYVYGALCSRAALALALGDARSARDLRRQAAGLKRRFNATFWLPHRGYYALALDADKRPVESLASNMGHCLWTGIIDRRHAPAVADALLGPPLFSGFGVRTLASSMGAYNPMSYHNGSVWPHDNAIIAAGLRRYGFVAEAQRIALGLVAAAEAFGGRLPELFCGFGRDQFARPVPYPTACSPQAWAAATPLLLLRTMLGLEPDVPAGEVVIDPALPEGMAPLTVDGVHLAGDRLIVAENAGSWSVRGLPPRVTLGRAGRRALDRPPTAHGRDDRG
jgi:glycogen debranching enzyme